MTPFQWAASQAAKPASAPAPAAAPNNAHYSVQSDGSHQDSSGQWRNVSGAAIPAPAGMSSAAPTGAGTAPPTSSDPMAGLKSADPKPGTSQFGSPTGAQLPPAMAATIDAQRLAGGATGGPIQNLDGTVSTNFGAGRGAGATSGTQSQAEDSAMTGLKNDLDDGKKFTEASGAFKDGAMGRVSDTTSASQADALAKAQALEGGLTGPAMRARQEQADQSIGAQEQANMMQLQGIQGNQGLRGASAGAQQAGMAYNALAQQQSANRQLTLDDLASKQSGVQNFLADNQANDSYNRAGTQYNNQQKNSEAAGRLSTPLTYAGMIQGVRSGADAGYIANRGADTADRNTDAATAKSSADEINANNDRADAKKKESVY